MEYDPKNIEPKWQEKWQAEKVYEPNLDGSVDAPGDSGASKNWKPFYNLMMFPYPSAEGLHVGNMYAFTGSDIYGRMKRMQGYDVFEPIGLDGFGIHSENYALKIGTHPMDQAAISEKRFYGQLQKIGNGFAWNEHVETYDPEFYKWTQWIFAEMFRRGLAYRKKQSVNWCPKDQTVLADEQVENGKCERCGTEVIKKELEQWFFKITAYEDRLLDNIAKLDWSEKVKIAQTNWIGKSEGAEISFLLDFKKNPADNDRRGPNGERAALTVFTTRPDTLFGATYLVLAPEHPWVMLAIDDNHDILLNKDEVKAYVAETAKKSERMRQEDAKEKTGVPLQGVVAINPINKQEIPIWIADYVLGGYGTGAVMGVPGHDERDFQFARKFNLPIVSVIEGDRKKESEVFMGDGPHINSDFLNGLRNDEAITKSIEWLEREKSGVRKNTYRLRDWLISRQRYWGPPIPMIFCEACAAKNVGERVDMPGWYAVGDKNLPVVLPHIADFRPTGTGKSPLASEKSFYEVACPKCGASARRETDVSDTFLDSAWYYLRYLDPNNASAAFNEKRIKTWLPAEMYIGGAEHAVLHLLYVRFVAMVLHDWKLIDFEEPFKKFRAHGLVIKDGAKMSKSKGNVINPDEYIENFGADTLRMYLMFLAPFQDGGDFRDSAILGIERFLKRAWKMGESVAAQKDRPASLEKSSVKPLLNKTIKKVTEDIETLHYNTAVSALMILLREFEESGAEQGDFEIFLKLLAPFAPHMTEELWREVFGHPTSIHREAWPHYDPALVYDEKVQMALQVNGKTRDIVEVDGTITEEAAKQLALANDKIKKMLGDGQPKKIIYVDKRLVNIVI